MDLRTLIAEAVGAARRDGEPATLQYVLARAFHAIWVPDTLAERLAHSAEAVRHRIKQLIDAECPAAIIVLPVPLDETGYSPPEPNRPEATTRKLRQ